MYKILKIEVEGTLIYKKTAAESYVDAFNLMYAKGLINDSAADDFDFIKRDKGMFSRSEQEHDDMLFLVKGAKDLWISTYNETERKYNFIKKVFDKYGINGTVEMIEVNGEETQRNNDNAMSKVKIYEIKSSASANSHELLSPDGKFFYWDNDQFKANEIGDKVFFIEKHQKWALYTEIKILEIPTTYNSENKTSTFNHDYNTYTVADETNKYKYFIRFDIIDKVTIPPNWRWTKQLGQSQVYDLWKGGDPMTNVEDRIRKIDDLEILFNNGDAYDLLEGARSKLRVSSLNQDIVDAINSPEIQAIVYAREFDLQHALDKWEEVKSYEEPYTGFLQNLLDDFISSNRPFTDYINNLQDTSEEYKLLYLLSEQISYCDLNAANKKRLNKYDDNRVVGKANIPQNEWIKYLLKFKINNNEFNVLSLSISHILSYLDNPLMGISMISIHHRQMVAKYLLRIPFDAALFVSQVVDYFRPYDINPKNPLNLTRIIGNLLYRFPKVKKLWFERISGLAASDTTNWKEEVIETLKQKKAIVLWWHRAPSKRSSVDKLLPETIRQDGFFYLYYFEGEFATYRARITDYGYDDDYASKNWNKNDDVAWYSDNIAEYTKSGGRPPRILFLTDQFIKLDKPISGDKFDFYESEPPRRMNLQPYSEVDWDEESETTEEIESTPTVKAENTMTPKEIIAHVHGYMRSKGFQYHLDEIANFYLALKTKPFVILAGISGTGKSQLPKQFANAIGMETEQVILVPVRPDWTDGSDLLGYTGLDNKFKPKDLTIAIIEAQSNPKKPFFFILDEMNLARVEHYFSDFLSVIETREWLNNEKSDIITDTILRKEVLQTADNTKDFRDLMWPKNLYLVGTVNMDETTHAFSRKVLDRANSIEMNEVNLDWAESSDEEFNALSGISNSFFETEFIGSIDLTEEDKGDIASEIGILKQVNHILQKADLHFAYRVRDEVAFYLLLNKKFKLMSDTAALDFQLVQKVLPRIHGSSERIQTVLIELLNLLEETSIPTVNFQFSSAESKIKFEDLKYKRSSRKILFMLKRFDDDRFTSFWL